MSINLIFFAIFPFIIYARIIVIARRHKLMENRLFATGSSSASNTYRNRFKDRKALNTFLVVTIASSATWIPFSLLAFYGYFANISTYNTFFTLLGLIISFSNNWINILIYTVRDRSFRKAAIKILSGRCGRQHLRTWSLKRLSIPSVCGFEPQNRYLIRQVCWTCFCCLYME